MPLDPEIAAFLDSQRLLPARSGLSIERARTRMVEFGRLYGGPLLDIPQVVDFTVDTVPVREYRAGEPILVYFHGGRFISGGIDSHDRLCRRLALAARCRLLAVDYRLAPEHRFPAALDDALSVLEWAAQQSDRVAVAGDSAGANLAAAVAAARRSRVSRQVLIYPMIDATRSLPSHVEFAEGWGPSSRDMKCGWDAYLPAGANPREPRISPIFTTDLVGIPPAFVLTAGDFRLRAGPGNCYAYLVHRTCTNIRSHRADSRTGQPHRSRAT
jgi:acetyl esterase